MDTVINMQALENTYNAAVEADALFIGVAVSIPGKPRDTEVIINRVGVFGDSKLPYYKKAYTNGLVLRANEAIFIKGFTYGHNFEEIQEDLLGA